MKNLFIFSITPSILIPARQALEGLLPGGKGYKVYTSHLEARWILNYFFNIIFLWIGANCFVWQILSCNFSLSGKTTPESKNIKIELN